MITRCAFSCLQAAAISGVKRATDTATGSDNDASVRPGPCQSLANTCDAMTPGRAYGPHSSPTGKFDVTQTLSLYSCLRSSQYLLYRNVDTSCSWPHTSTPQCDRSHLLPDARHVR